MKRLCPLPHLFLLAATATGATLACSRVPEGADAPSSTPPRAVTARNVTPANATHLKAAPLRVHLDGPAAPAAGEDIQIRVRLERTSSESPVHYRIAVPSGARLISGTLDGDMPAGSLSTEQVLTLHLDSVPGADLSLSAAAEGPSYGAHARSDYRFGRPEPTLPEPARADHVTKIGHRNFGRGIPLGPPHDAGK